MISVRTDSELSAVVQESAQQERPIFPTGGQTQQHRLAQMREQGVQVDLRSMNQLVDYPHQDMTITVQAGMTMRQLSQLLEKKGQTLPIDVPRPDEATVGGSIAANINGPRSTGWGTWRDYVIGLSWINDQGEKTKAGGRVVKNVAGYDFCKLFTGSLGTLGIVTQVTLKVKPQPEAIYLASFDIQRDDAVRLTHLILQSRLQPTVFVMQPNQKETWSVWLCFEGSSLAVDWQYEHLREMSAPFCKLSDRNESNAGIEARRSIGELTQFELGGSFISFQARVRRSRCLEVVHMILHPLMVLQVQPQSGVLIGHLVGTLEEKEVKRIMRAVRAAMLQDGHLTLLRCPAEWREELQPFGPPRPDWLMMQRVKRAMDPRNLFQRGRHEIMEATWRGGQHG